jgi:predicted nucleic acid-binding protein
MRKKTKFLVKPIDDVFVDVMIFRDVVGARLSTVDKYPLWASSVKLLMAVLNGEIKRASTSFMSILGVASENKIAYPEKQANQATLNFVNTFMIPYFQIIYPDPMMLEKALQYTETEFEDALIFLSAQRAKANNLLTRDVKHFLPLVKDTQIAVLSPEDVVGRPRW